MTATGLTTVYVALLEEGTHVWRPVLADDMGGGLFVLRGTVPDEERWAFAPGATVRCVERTLSGGTRALVAVEQVHG
jgi:hypothetical protein